MSSINWKSSTAAPQVTSESTDSTSSLSTTGSTGQAQATGYVDPKMALEESSFKQGNHVTAAQQGHRLLSSNPPLPSDGVNMTNETRTLATATQQKMHTLGNAYTQGPDSGTASALGNHPERDVNPNTSEKFSTVTRDENDGEIDPYSNNDSSDDSSPMSVTSSGSTVSAGSDTTDTSDTTTTGGSDGYISDSKDETTTSADSKEQDAADKMLKDANKGGSCGHDSMQQDVVKMNLSKEGLSGDEVKFVMDQMKTNSSQSGQALADAVVAMEQNPQYKDQIMSSISTMAANESEIGSNSNAASAYNNAQNNLESTVKGLGFSNLGEGTVEAGVPPTPGQNGWQIWAPETET